MQRWEGELERRYILQRAWRIHDAYSQHRNPLPAFLQTRALPEVHIVTRQEEEQQQVGAAGKRKPSNEASGTGEEETLHATLVYVTTQLEEALFKEFMEGFHKARA
jgi:hypothetical protein